VVDDTAGADADPPEKLSGEKVKGVVNWFNVAKGFGASSWLSRHPACSSIAILRSPPGGGVDSMREHPPQASSIAGVFPRCRRGGPRLGSKHGPSPAQPRSLFAHSHAIFMRNRVRARGSRRSAGAVSDTRSAPREPIDALGGASCVVARGEPSGTLVRANPHRGRSHKYVNFFPGAGSLAGRSPRSFRHGKELTLVTPPDASRRFRDARRWRRRRLRAPV
jgi:hypothetical protein